MMIPIIGYDYTAYMDIDVWKRLINFVRLFTHSVTNTNFDILMQLLIATEWQWYDKLAMYLYLCSWVEYLTCNNQLSIG